MTKESFENAITVAVDGRHRHIDYKLFKFNDLVSKIDLNTFHLLTKPWSRNNLDGLWGESLADHSLSGIPVLKAGSLLSRHKPATAVR